jgi:hypothetical protein
MVDLRKIPVQIPILTRIEPRKLAMTAESGIDRAYFWGYLTVRWELAVFLFFFYDVIALKLRQNCPFGKFRRR